MTARLRRLLGELRDAFWVVPALTLVLPLLDYELLVGAMFDLIRQNAAGRRFLKKVTLRPAAGMQSGSAIVIGFASASDNIVGIPPIEFVQPAWASATSGFDKPR